jgi:hypothetical protein
MKKLAFLVIVAALAYSFVQEQGVSIPGLSSWNNSTETAHSKLHTAKDKVIFKFKEKALLREFYLMTSRDHDTRNSY